MRSYNLLLELSSEHLKLPYKCQWAVSMSPSVHVGGGEPPPTTTPVHAPMATTLSEVDDSEELFSDASADYWGDVEENRSYASRKPHGESAESGSRENHVPSSGRRDLATVQPPGEIDGYLEY
ncbi:hypothetical protein AAVH_12416 [Aphelenchoides avenae]|nr:hypothetical protein AAVH_12416 [Aphelenchus avenae]